MSNEENFYSTLMENNVWKVVAVGYAIVSIIVQVVLLYGIIWFERFGSDKRRTLLNMLVASGP